MTIDAIKAVVDLIEMGGVVGQEDIVKCLRSAIEQAERQEPVAWVCTCGANLYVDDAGRPCSKVAPPQRQPLTDAERNHLWETIYDHGNGKYQGEQSRAQRARAFEILKMIGGGG